MRRCFKNEYSFGAELLRWTFGLIFVIAAVQKFGMGVTGFAEMLSGGEGALAQAIPSIVYVYGIVLPFAELAAGALLLLHFHTKEAYFAIAVMYLTFIFGMLYDGNATIVGSQYVPAAIGISLGMFFHVRSEQ